MVFKRDTALNDGEACVVLPNNAAAETAIRDLNGSALFHQRVEVMPAEAPPPDKTEMPPNLFWDWRAPDSPDVRREKTLGVCLQSPKGIFRLIQEGRTVVLDIPAKNLLRPDVYTLLRKYNVESVSKHVLYPRGKHMRSANTVDLYTRKEADAAMHELNGLIYKSIEPQFRRW